MPYGLRNSVTRILSSIHSRPPKTNHKNLSARQDKQTKTGGRLKGKPSIRVLLVDDHLSVLEGIRLYLQRKPGIRIVGQATDGNQAVQMVKNLTPDVLLMDLSLPGMGGLEVMKIVACDVSRTKILVYTIHKSTEFVEEAKRSGASGYVLKSSSLSVLARAIESVDRGGTFFDPGISKCLPSLQHDLSIGINESTPGGFVKRETYSLTVRERQILKMMADGLTMKEIAKKLNVSYNTMIPHAKHIHEKLRVNTRGAVVAKALREKLV